MSSHRIDELSTYAQRICFLDAGTVFYEGTPQGIVTRFRGLPATAESQETFYKAHPKIDWIDLLNFQHSADRALPVAILHPPLVTQPLIVLYGTPQTFDTLSQEGAELNLLALNRYSLLSLQNEHHLVILHQGGSFLGSPLANLPLYGTPGV